MNLTLPPNKSFRKDIEYFHHKLLHNENFTLSKYADGEWAVLENRHINNKEFWFDPDNKNDKIKRDKLWKSFQYKNPRYYVGISCPCCQGMEVFNKMNDMCFQDETNLTWANIWVNSNYRYFVENIIPLFSNRTVVLFCNKNSKIQNLPFSPYLVFPLENNSWEYNWNLIEESKYAIEYINKTIQKNLLVLFCCGPFGNILSYELTKDIPDNTYLDIGSTLNPWLQSEGFKRDYYMGNTFFANMICRWGK